MTDNRDKEIVALAVEWAEDVLNDDGPLRYDSDQRRARGILALASSPEPVKPERFPGIDAEPKLEQPMRGRYQIYAVGEWSVYGPLGPTPAAAVSAWNEMIDRIAGGDDETVRLVGDLTGMLNHPDADVLHRARRWLAERTGGADGR